MNNNAAPRAPIANVPTILFFVIFIAICLLSFNRLPSRSDIPVAARVATRHGNETVGPPAGIPEHHVRHRPARKWQPPQEGIVGPGLAKGGSADQDQLAGDAAPEIVAKWEFMTSSDRRPSLPLVGSVRLVVVPSEVAALSAHNKNHADRHHGGRHDKDQNPAAQRLDHPSPSRRRLRVTESATLREGCLRRAQRQQSQNRNGDQERPSLEFDLLAQHIWKVLAEFYALFLTSRLKTEHPSAYACCRSIRTAIPARLRW